MEISGIKSSMALIKRQKCHCAFKYMVYKVYKTDLWNSVRSCCKWETGLKKPHFLHWPGKADNWLVFIHNKTHLCINQSHSVLWVFMWGRSCTPSFRKRSCIASEFLLTMSRSTTKAGVQRSLMDSVLLAILKRCTHRKHRLDSCMEAVFQSLHIKPL